MRASLRWPCLMTASFITEQELEQKLLAACNRLRGPVDPTDYKAYIFPLLFLKRISDYWDWEYARALDAFDGDEKLARLEDNFRFVLPEGCHWSDVQALTENVGVEHQKILQRIELANSDTLAGIFGDVQWARASTIRPAARAGCWSRWATSSASTAVTPGR
jgi:type I restriction enzyme M protein